MSEFLLQITQKNRIWSILIILAALVSAALLGGTVARASVLLPLMVAAGILLLLQRPVLGLMMIVVAALILPISIRTGSMVRLNPVMLLIPAMAAIWLLDMARKRELALERSRTFLPLVLFVILATVSLLIGNATWDPFVPRPGNFLLVQLGQLAIFFLSGAAFLLMAHLVKDEVWLKYLVWCFFIVGGGLAIVYFLPEGKGIIRELATSAFSRAPFWMLLAAMAGGQLLFNKTLRPLQQLFLVLVLLAVGYYSFVLQREVISIWIGVLAAAAMLLWLRFPRFRWLALAILVTLFLAGFLFPAAYEFAGGDAEWRLSGISRIDLGKRVLQVSMRNPITGLGPASYRVYASVEPLVWRGGQSLWIGANISSHNNYVDIFSHVGLVGLAIFLWFMVEVALLGFRLRKRYASNFTSGYINGVLAAWAGSIMMMALADWFLPFVYNIGFRGFQASVLVWLFMGGLVAISMFPDKEDPQK